ncbi:Stk1 family PASTA domain-containing Ser/Thr kinase [Jatrophihabitans fulvus]
MATKDPLVGRTLEGRYRLLDRIARGGMSTVYAAVDQRLDRMVAVKVMSSALSADPAFSDRFAREARAAARLTHLNAVSVYDQGYEIAQDGHHVFLVMELVEGRTLRELIRERGRLTPAEAVSIMEPVLSALSAAHRAGLVHRDIKPENILLSDEGVVKVADFGLARAVETDPTSTRTGLMMGTVAYCAPEQITRGHADPRSDVYSAGIVFFELLTGTPPFTGESAMNVAYQHVHSRVPAPSSRVKSGHGQGEIPSEIDEIVVAATDSDPASRPTDAGALLAELADVRTELSLPITPVPPRPRPKRENRTRPAERRGPDSDTTQSIRRRPGNDTAVVPSGGPSRNGTSRLDDRRPERRDTDRTRPPGSPPPPVVSRPEDRRARKRRRAAIITIVVLLLGVAAFFGAKAFVEWRFAHVPKVVGQTQAAAVESLKDAGYKVVVDPGKEFSEKIPLDHVYRVSPGEGSQLSTGSTVRVTLSAGRQTWQIPTTRGQEYTAAVDELRSVGPLKVAASPKQKYDAKVPENRVLYTIPAAGARVTRSDTVTIVVSRGPAPVKVPAIPQGTPAEDAKNTLRAKNFAIDTVDQFDDNVPAGQVISVSPTGTQPNGATITITVSKGPEMVKVPDIGFGDKLSDALAKLQEAGLVADVNNPTGRSPDDARVYSVNPDGGTTVRAGSTVTLFVV